jgi:hypothetical protein
MSRTEQEMLNLAEECKEVVEKKDRMISYLKDKMSGVEDQLREMEYKLSQIKYLTEYKTKQKGTDKIYLNTIKDDIERLLGLVDRGRTQLQDDSDDEEVILMLFGE